MELIKTTILGLFFGTFGTTLGGLLGIFIKKNSNKFSFEYAYVTIFATKNTSTLILNGIIIFFFMIILLL